MILGLAVCAVLAGARSFTAIAGWAADADEQTLARLGVTGPVPSEPAFRRTLQQLDADAFDDLAGRWAQQCSAPGPKQRRAIAVDGKTLRGSAHGGEDGRHLLAALDHTHGVVLGQVEVGAQVPVAHQAHDRGHGRERRTLEVTSVSRGAERGLVCAGRPGRGSRPAAQVRQRVPAVPAGRPDVPPPAPPTPAPRADGATARMTPRAPPGLSA